MLTICLAITITYCHKASACTRVVYKGLDGLVLTARSMDWSSDLHTNLWILPRGIERTGEEGPQSIKWTSKYG
ncbi:linear amide C-N hydrolase, partial [Flavobacterium sp. SCIV07]